MTAFSALKDHHLHPLLLAQASVKPLPSSIFASNLQETRTALDNPAKVTLVAHYAGFNFKPPIAALFLEGETLTLVLARSFAPLDGFESKLRASQAATRSVKLPPKKAATATQGYLDPHSSHGEFE